MNDDIIPVMLDRNVIYESDRVTLYSDLVKMPDGQIIPFYHKIPCPHEAISVIIFNAKNEIMMIQSKRYITSRLEWEIPTDNFDAEITDSDQNEVYAKQRVPKNA